MPVLRGYRIITHHTVGNPICRCLEGFIPSWKWISLSRSRPQELSFRKLWTLFRFLFGRGRSKGPESVITDIWWRRMSDSRVKLFRDITYLRLQCPTETYNIYPSARPDQFHRQRLLSFRREIDYHLRNFGTAEIFISNTFWWFSLS